MTSHVPTFLVLPAEIRPKIYQQIYKDVVVRTPSAGRQVHGTYGLAHPREENQLGDVSSPDPNPLAPDYESSRTSFALLHTCRTTRAESAPVFQRTVLFHITDPANAYQLVDSLLLLGHPATKSISNIMINDKEALGFYRMLAEGKLFLPNLKNVIVHKDDSTASNDRDSRPSSKDFSGCIHQIAES
jgi:hypothetical protein